MSFRMLFYATVAMPFAAGLASAELRLSEPEMDTMTAGVLPEQFALIDCPACAVTTSASTSLNGVTTTSMNGVTTTTTGSTGTAGGGGSGNAGGGGSVLGVFIGSVPVPPGIAATLNQASVVTASHP